MNTGDDRRIFEIIKHSTIGTALVFVETARDSDLTSAKFRRRSDDYFDVSEPWDTESTAESVAEALIAKAMTQI